MGNYQLPARTADTMSFAIAMSSPSGRMSKRAKQAASERLRVALFGENGLPEPSCKQPSQKEYLLQRASMLREMAARGLKPRALVKEAARLELEAATC